MASPSNLYGFRFGRLLVLERAASDRHGKTKWLCMCDCGTSTEVSGQSLLRCETQSCGCLQRDLTSMRARSHGLTDTPEHQIWRAMKMRCYNPKNKSFKNYGGRGIRVCEKWKNSFSAFLNDMGFRPSPELTVERIDNDGDYEPSNCKWATRLEQRHNQRRTKRAA